MLEIALRELLDDADRLEAEIAYFTAPPLDTGYDGRWSKREIDDAVLSRSLELNRLHDSIIATPGNLDETVRKFWIGLDLAMAAGHSSERSYAFFRSVEIDLVHAACRPDPSYKHKLKLVKTDDEEETCLALAVEPNPLTNNPVTALGRSPSCTAASLVDQCEKLGHELALLTAEEDKLWEHDLERFPYSQIESLSGHIDDQRDKSYKLLHSLYDELAVTPGTREDGLRKLHIARSLVADPPGAAYCGIPLLKSALADLEKAERLAA